MTCVLLKCPFPDNFLKRSPGTPDERQTPERIFRGSRISVGAVKAVDGSACPVSATRPRTTTSGARCGEPESVPRRLAP
jgi:hypothetical protein